MYYRINMPRVAHELIDGEVIAIDFETGNYYSLNETGGFLWSLLVQGASIEQLIEAVVQNFSNSRAEVEPTIRAYVAQLEAEELVVADSSDQSTPASVDTQSIAVQSVNQTHETAPFIPPTLEVYTDMQGLLLLDPIHEVDEQGWPVRK
jgi:hypothetical protein